jgi:uncharacterized protein (TIGR02265 family)
LSKASKFEEPPWDSPIDVAAVVRGIPPSASVAGKFLEAVAERARRKGQVLPSAREKYLPFRFYPVRELAQLIVEASNRLYPELSTRRALRRLGYGAPGALVESTIGKIVLGSASGVRDVLSGMAKAYPLHLRPCTVEVREVAKGRLIIRMEEILYFLDSHHVGVFESAMRFASIEGKVQICSYSPTSADLLCTWDEP